MEKTFTLVLLAAGILLLSGCQSAQYCGDDICESTEDATSCPMDCRISEKSCPELGGFLCARNETCESGQMYSASEENCCAVQCTPTQKIIAVEIDKCSSDLDCDDQNIKTRDQCADKPKKCNHASVACSDLNGSFCASGTSCFGTYVALEEGTCCLDECKPESACSALNCGTNERCLGGRCIPKTCEEQGGKPCILPKTCTQGKIAASNATTCCRAEYCQKVEPVFREETIFLSTGESKTGIEGKNSYEDQKLLLKLEMVIELAPNNYYARFGIYDQQEMHIKSQWAKYGENLEKLLKDEQGNEIIKPKIYVEQLQLNTFTGIGTAMITVTTIS